MKNNAQAAEKLLQGLTKPKNTRAPQLRETMSVLWKKEIKKRIDAAVEAHKNTHNGQISPERVISIVQEVKTAFMAGLTTEERQFLKEEHDKRLEERRIAKEEEEDGSDVTKGDEDDKIGVPSAVEAMLK